MDTMEQRLSTCPVWEEQCRVLVGQIESDFLSIISVVMSRNRTIRDGRLAGDDES